MQEAVIATFLFWCTFVFSAGPFWIATMEAAPNTSFARLYSDYVLYLVFGWLPVLVASSLLSGLVAGIDIRVLTGLHLLGGAYVCYLAYKVIRAKVTKGTGFDFDWKAMSLVTYFNPKVWILVPIGFLTASVSDSLLVRIAFYYFSGIPVFLFGVFFWGIIGRAGARISFRYISYFNAILLTAFGGYLIFQGIRIAMQS